MGIFERACFAAPPSGLESAAPLNPATDLTASGELARADSIFGRVRRELRVTVVEEEHAGLAAAMLRVPCPHCGR